MNQPGKLIGGQEMPLIVFQDPNIVKVPFPETLMSAKERKTYNKQKKKTFLNELREVDKKKLDEAITKNEQTGEHIVVGRIKPQRPSKTAVVIKKEDLQKQLKQKETLEKLLDRDKIEKEIVRGKEALNKTTDLNLEKIQKSLKFKEPGKNVATLRERIRDKTFLERVNSVYATKLNKNPLQKVMGDLDIGADLFAYYVEGSKGIDPTAWKFMKKEDVLAEEHFRQQLRNKTKTEFMLFTLPEKNPEVRKKREQGQVSFVENIDPQYRHRYQNVFPVLFNPNMNDSFIVSTTDGAAMQLFVLRQQEKDNINYKIESQYGREVYEITKPFPDLSKENDQKAIFRPGYKNITYNLRFQQFLMDYNNYIVNHVTEKNEGFYFIMRKIREVINICDTHFYGNGSMRGQMGRFNQCIEINEYNPPNDTNMGGVPKGKKAKKAFYTWVFKTWGIKWPTIRFETNNVTDINMKFKDKYDRAAIIINESANAGAMWEQGTKRRETIIQDMILASLLIKDCEDVDKIEFHRRWGFTYLAKMKPKDEVQEVADLDNKTRNFWEFNSFVFIGLQMLLTDIFKNAETFSFESDNRSLNGWSALKGGGTRIYDFIIAFYKSEKRWEYLVYCDNVYLLYKFKGKGWEKEQVFYVSLDVKKAEASTSEYNIEDFFNLVRVMYTKASALSKCWNGYIDYLYRLLTSYRSLYMGNQMKGFGIPSGTMGTGYMNQFKTLNFMYHFLLRKVDPVVDMLKGQPVFSKEWEEEVFTRRSQFKVVAVTNVTEVCEGTQKHLSVLDLDLLGYSGVYYKDKTNTTIICALDIKRLLPTMCFFRPDFRAGEEEGSYDKIMLDFVKTRILFMTGGWAYEGINSILRGYCSYLLKNIKKGINEQIQLDNIMSLVEQLGMADIFSEAELNSSVRWLTTGSSPTLSDALALCGGESVAQSYIYEIIEDQGNLENLARYISAIDAAQLLNEEKISTEIFEALYASSPLAIDYISIIVDVRPEVDIPTLELNVTDLRRYAKELNHTGYKYEDRNVYKDVSNDPLQGVRFGKTKDRNLEVSKKTLEEYRTFLDTTKNVLKPLNRTRGPHVLKIDSYIGVIYKQCLEFISNIHGIPLNTVSASFRFIKIEWIEEDALSLLLKVYLGELLEDSEFDLFYHKHEIQKLDIPQNYKDVLIMEAWELNNFKPTRKKLTRRGFKLVTDLMEKDEFKKFKPIGVWGEDSTEGDLDIKDFSKLEPIEGTNIIDVEEERKKLQMEMQEKNKSVLKEREKTREDVKGKRDLKKLEQFSPIREPTTTRFKPQRPQKEQIKEEVSVKKEKEVERDKPVRRKRLTPEQQKELKYLQDLQELDKLHKEDEFLREKKIVLKEQDEEPYDLKREMESENLDLF